MSPSKLHSGLLGSLAALLLTTFACGEAPYDLVIRNGTVIDGTGTEGRKADVGIRDGKIVRVGDLGSASSTGIIDASGLVVAPGFIDIHNHSDNTILVDPRAESMVRQGVTTMILGESGSAGPVVGKASRELPYGLKRDWTTLGGYFERLEKQGIATNVASYVGQGQVWTCVVGYENRSPSNEELEEMKKLVAQAHTGGAGQHPSQRLSLHGRGHHPQNNLGPSKPTSIPTRRDRITCGPSFLPGPTTAEMK